MPAPRGAAMLAVMRSIGARLGWLCVMLGGCLDGGGEPGDDDSAAAAGCAVECGVDPASGVDCGGCADGSCVDGACVPGCTPQTCESLGASCGQEVPDGCGGTVSCGTCPQQSSCLPDAGWTCGCVSAADGDTVILAVDAVDATIAVTLAGQDPAEVGSAESDYGALLLEPMGPRAAGFEQVRFPLGQGPGAVALRAVPGRYVVWYQRIGTDAASPWPRNRRLRLGEVEWPAATPAVLDIPVVTVTVDLRLDGVRVAELAEPDTLVEIALRGESPQDEILLWRSGDPAPGAVRVAPGTYRVAYRRLEAGADLLSPWPLGRGESLGEVLVADDGPVVVDIATAVVDAGLRVDGARPSPPGVDLQLFAPPIVAPVGAPVQPMPTPAPVVLPLRANPQQVRVVAGTVDVRYAGEAAADPWPFGRFLLAIDHDLTGGLDFEVQTAVVHLNPTLAGAAIDSANTAADDDVGALRLAMRTARGRDLSSPAPALWDDGPVAPTVRLAYGVWDVLYVSGEAPMAHWPTALRPVPVTLGVFVDGDREVDVDVPVATLDIAGTIDGAPPAVDGAATFEWSAWNAPGAETVVDLGWSPAPSVRVPVVATPARVRVVPGSYLVSYKPPESPGGLPTAAWVLDDVVQVVGDVSLQLPVSSRGLTLGMAVNGEEEGDAFDHARLWLTRLQPQRATQSWLDFASEDGVLRHGVRLPPGRYEVQIYPPQSRQSATPPTLAWRRWPETAGVNAGCLVVDP